MHIVLGLYFIFLIFTLRPRVDDIGGRPFSAKIAVGSSCDRVYGLTTANGDCIGVQCAACSWRGTIRSVEYLRTGARIAYSYRLCDSIRARRRTKRRSVGS